MPRGEDRLEAMLQGHGIYSALDIVRQSKYAGRELAEMQRRYPNETASVLQEVLQVARQSQGAGSGFDFATPGSAPTSGDIPDAGGIQGGRTRVSAAVNLEIGNTGVTIVRRYVREDIGIPTAEGLEKGVKEKFEAEESEKYHALRVKGILVEYVLKGQGV